MSAPSGDRRKIQAPGREFQSPDLPPEEESSMELLNHEEVDSLGNLEDRIRKAVDMVAQLRIEREELRKQLESAESEKQSLAHDAEEARGQATRLAQELETLRSERKQVRTRIEKLLGQMDILSAS